MRKFLLVLLVLMVPCLFLACGKEEAKVEKPLRVGMTMDFPPFEFIDPNDKSLKGFDVDVMEAIGSELGVGIDFQDINYDDLFNVLEKDNIDVVISAVTVTDERKNKVDFTKPYFESGIAIATLESEKNIKSFADLPGKRVAVVVGAASAREMKEQRSVDILELPTLKDAFNALQSGNVAAVVNDKSIIDYHLKETSGLRVKILPDIYKEEHYAIALRKGNGNALQKMDDALQKIKDKGIYDKIYEKWFGEKIKK